MSETTDKMITDGVGKLVANKEKVYHLFKKSLYEPNGTEVSSSRVFGAIIIVVVCMCQFFLTGVLGVKIMQEIDLEKLRVLIGAFKYMMYAYLILVATALTLYGTNVWKYIAEIKNGKGTTPDTNEEA